MPNSPFDEINVDTVTITPKGVNGENYSFNLTDRVSRVRRTRPRIYKERYLVLTEFYALIKNYEDKSIKCFWIDHGTELGGQALTDWAAINGVQIAYSSTYTLEQNGVSEVANRLINNTARCLQVDSGIPEPFWPYTTATACQIMNMLVGKNGKARCQILTNTDQPVDLSQLRRYGCVSYIHVPQQQRKRSEKVSPRAIRGYLVGYQGTKIYKIWISEINKLKISPHVEFHEDLVYKNSYRSDDFVAANSRLLDGGDVQDLSNSQAPEASTTYCSGECRQQQP